VSVAFGEFEYDPNQRELRRDGQRLKVDAKLLQLLGYFLANPGRLLSKRELLDRVWEGRAVADNVLSVSVAKLRKILGHEQGKREFIENSYGRGYRFVVQVDPIASPPPAASTGNTSLLPSSPLVGRNSELQRLDAALQRAKAGRGSICLLLGEPGIGKTRLAEALEQRARMHEVAVAWGRCQASEGTPPLWPLSQMLRDLQDSGLLNDQTQVPSERNVNRERSDGASMLSHVALYEAVSSSHGTIDAVTQALFAASKRQPLLLLIDDLQWADAASLRLLCYLVGEISRWPILVVAMQRSTHLMPDERTDRDLLRLYAHANCERIQLDRLQNQDVDEYLRAQFGERARELSRAVFERSEGNPFFMVELLRPFVGSGEPTPEQLKVSAPALELVRERLRDLPEVSLEVLSAAAVIGHDFDLGLLSYVTERSPHELLEALDGSLANDTIVPSSKLLGAYAFDHALIREVLYDDLPARKRCSWHARAGEGLSRRRRTGGEVSSAELAHHFLSALPHGDVALAVEHAREAATAATCMAAHADARSLLRRALASLQFAVDPDPETRTALLLELAIVERVMADPAYYDHLDQGVSLARSLRLGSMLTLAGRFLSPGPGILVKADAAGVLEAAAEVLPESDIVQRAIVLAHQSWTPPHSWSAANVSELVEQAEQLATRSGNSEALAAVRDAQLYFSGGPATHARAEALMLEVERELEAHPDIAGQWRAAALRVFRVINATQRGDAAGLARAVDELSTLHQRMNNTELRWHHERMLLVQRMNRGEWSGVADELARLSELARRLRLQSWRAIVAVDYSKLLLNTSDASELSRKLRPELLATAYDSPNTRSLKLRTLAQHGFIDDVRDGLAMLSPAAIEDLPQDRDYLASLADFGVAAVVTRSLEHAEVVYRLLAPYPNHFAIGLSFHCQGSISHTLGNLAHVLGRDEQAVLHLANGVAQNERFGAMSCMLHTKFDLARLLAAEGPVRSLARARELLQETIEQAGQRCMRPLQDAARELLARVS
jgi:DNA-binding winged helix-turn-helix (wHTH) protein